MKKASQKAVQEPSDGLNLKQLRALENLEDAAASLRRWHGKSPDELECDELFLVAYGEWERAMIHAARAGLSDHPTVRNFILTRKGMGSWKVLRKARSGYEKGTRQWDPSDVRLIKETLSIKAEYEREHQKPLTQKRLQQLLRVKGFIPKMTRQGFHKLLKRLDLLDTFRPSANGL